MLEEVDKGTKKQAVADRFGIPPSSLSTILKKQNLILHKSGELTCEPARKRVKLC